ncbi:hypothetical protein HIM_08680 [Hirsutella minnesotensis 3608]|uniref:Rhodopsin domain-containing protein n=1 Tax=Hirsutella minnesotensis 3608 TaxID=1043627 RepID=A0A0F8A3J2_9HYPO|nr:hypothetical protein HIM_08680 [Hirsutella minnesotensis 3608]
MTAHLPVTPSDHGAYIVIAAVIGVTWSVLVLAIRLYIRFRLNGPYGIDDAAATFATVVAVCQTSVALAAVHNGLGRRTELLTDQSHEAALKLNYAANLLYLLAIGSSKCSMSLLMSRLTRYTHSRVASHVITALAAGWTFAAMILIGLQCTAPNHWDTSDLSKCPTFFTRWAVAEGFSLLVEVLISSMAVVLVWNLSMATRTKVMVVLAFSAQLLVAIPVALRLEFLRSRVRGPASDPLFAATNSAIATQVVVHLSVMAATFPCLRQFLQAFDSGLGATTKIPTELGTGSRSQHSHSGYILQSRSVAGGTDDGRSVRRNNNKGRMSPAARLRPDPTAVIVSQATADPTASEPSERRSTDSFGSDKAIIWKTQKWEIKYGGWALNMTSTDKKLLLTHELDDEADAANGAVAANAAVEITRQPSRRASVTSFASSASVAQSVSSASSASSAPSVAELAQLVQAAFLADHNRPQPSNQEAIAPAAAGPIKHVSRRMSKAGT